MEELMIGQYSGAVLIGLTLVLVFKLLEGDKPGSMSNRAKILVTIMIGLCFGFVFFLYAEAAWTPKIIITFLVNGFAASCMASGLWTYIDKGVMNK